MNIREFRKVTRNFTEENITLDGKHPYDRAEERDVFLGHVMRMLLDQSAPLVRLNQAGPKRYRLYYRLSEGQEVKVIVDLLKPRRVNIRTVYGFRKHSRFPVDKYNKEENISENDDETHW